MRTPRSAEGARGPHDFPPLERVRTGPRCRAGRCAAREGFIAPPPPPAHGRRTEAGWLAGFGVTCGSEAGFLQWCIADGRTAQTASSCSLDAGFVVVIDVPSRAWPRSAEQRAHEAARSVGRHASRPTIGRAGRRPCCRAGRGSGEGRGGGAGGWTDGLTFVESRRKEEGGVLLPSLISPQRWDVRCQCCCCCCHRSVCMSCRHRASTYVMCVDSEGWRSSVMAS
ncbi:hypothetical protein FKP32DRAFT_856582 [Trametes sanguinea]|nr:hypothetical protein FKP32DRAFT_856582 [Trametes sanguinea]